MDKKTLKGAVEGLHTDFGLTDFEALQIALKQEQIQIYQDANVLTEGDLAPIPGMGLNAPFRAEQAGEGTPTGLRMLIERPCPKLAGGDSQTPN